MRKLKNTLYVTTRDSALSLENKGILIRTGEEKRRFPAIELESILLFGSCSVTTPLIRFCAENGISLCFYSEYGRFYGRVEGGAKGSILLRDAQFRLAHDEAEKRERIVLPLLTGKLRNAREVLSRAAREAGVQDALPLKKYAASIRTEQRAMLSADSIVRLRGMEGAAARAYFSGFARMVKAEDEALSFSGRSCHPPRDRINALLSFVYTLLCGDIDSALESTGLDMARGFMHSARPGKPALALDLMEEFRAPLCDRFVLSLIHLKQIGSGDFLREREEWRLTEQARRRVIDAWQKRKRETVYHPELEERIEIGLLPFAQAMLLARAVRGDRERYTPFCWR